MSGAAGNVDDATGSVLSGHLPVGADAKPERTDQVHLPRISVKQCRAFVVVLAARCALDTLHEFGNVLDVRCRYGPAGVVHQDVDPAVRAHDFADKGVDRLVVTLIADLLGGSVRPVRVDAGDGIQRRARAPDDGGPGAQQLMGDADAHAPAGSGDDRDLPIEDSHHIHPSELLTVTAIRSYSAIPVFGV